MLSPGKSRGRLEEPGGLQSMGSLRVGHDWATSLSLFTLHFHALEKETATHSSVLAWRIPGTGEPGGLPSMGWQSRTRLKWLSSSSSSSRDLKQGGWSQLCLSEEAFEATGCRSVGKAGFLLSSSPQSPKAGPALFVLGSGTTRQPTALNLRTSADKPEKSGQWRLSRCESRLHVYHPACSEGTKPPGTRLAVMGPGDLSPSLWIPVSPPAAKVKTTQCWSSHPQRLSREGKKCSHKQSCRQEKYRFEGLLARPVCDMVIKWELWFCFLYILQQVKWGRGSHLWSLFRGQEPCPGPLSSGREWELRVQELNCGFRRLTHSSRSISSVCSDCCYHSLLGPFCFELVLYKGPYICYFLSNWENPLPQFSAAPQQNFLLLLFCSCSFLFMYW